MAKKKRKKKRLKKMQNVINYVSPERRRRDSKMADMNNRYAYSLVGNIIHDRDCKFVQYIPDEAFEMSHDFISGYELCTHCRRRAIIRLGIVDNRKRLDAFVRFFFNARISNAWLIELFVVRRAVAIWIRIGEIELVVDGEHWRLKIVDDGLEIYHNHWTFNEVGNRVILNGFHKQVDRPIDPYFAMSIILKYSKHQFEEANNEGDPTKSNEEDADSE